MSCVACREGGRQQICKSTPRPCSLEISVLLKPLGHSLLLSFHPSTLLYPPQHLKTLPNPLFHIPRLQCKELCDDPWLQEKTFHDLSLGKSSSSMRLWKMWLGQDGFDAPRTCTMSTDLSSLSSCGPAAPPPTPPLAPHAMASKFHLFQDASVQACRGSSDRLGS